MHARDGFELICSLADLDIHDRLETAKQYRSIITTSHLLSFTLDLLQDTDRYEYALSCAHVINHADELESLLPLLPSKERVVFAKMVWTVIDNPIELEQVVLQLPEENREQFHNEFMNFVHEMQELAVRVEEPIELPKKKIDIETFNTADEFYARYEDFMLQAPEDLLQTELAPVLRKIAIAHLLRDSDYGINFRNQFLLIEEQDSLDEYLYDQSQNGTWATDIQAFALADFFHLRLRVTDVQARDTASKIYSPGTENDQLPTLDIHNRGNNHWYFKKYAGTLGDGNCLYNAFAQGLQHCLRLLKGLNPGEAASPTYSTSHVLFKPTVQAKSKESATQLRRSAGF